MVENEAPATPSDIPYRDDLCRVERAGRLAWPALETANVDGWICRYSGGGFGRSNSVFTLDFAGADVEGAIDRVEFYYRSRGRRPRFRVSEVSEPAGLLDVLKARGYHKEAGALTLAKPAQLRRPDLTGIEWGDFPTPNWLRIYLGVIDEPRQRTVPDLLAAVPLPRAFFKMRMRGLTLSCGLATIEDGIATLECIATREEARGRGCARAILGGIETWAREQGAHTLHLGVDEKNERAIKVYRKFGFEQVGSYAYWVPDAIAVPPFDDGEVAKRFPAGMELPAAALPSVSGALIDPAALAGTTVVAIYPWTGRPGLPIPVEWDEILGAHGSTPELEGFRELDAALKTAGARVLAVSGQGSDHQREMATRLKLPFEVLSDAEGKLREAWQLPVFSAGKQTFLRRLTLVLRDGKLVRCFAPVHPPAAHAREVLDWLRPPGISG